MVAWKMTIPKCACVFFSSAPSPHGFTYQNSDGFSLLSKEALQFQKTCFFTEGGGVDKELHLVSTRFDTTNFKGAYWLVLQT